MPVYYHPDLINLLRGSADHIISSDSCEQVVTTSTCRHLPTHLGSFQLIIIIIIIKMKIIHHIYIALFKVLKDA